MRILNKMKKTMLVLAASLFCANVAFADTWVSVIANGDFEGTEAASFVVKENGGANAGAFVAPAFADGIGKDGSRGIKVTSYAGATNDWDAQFWIAASNTLPAGTKYRVSFDYRASAAVNVGTQAHGEPGSYLHNDAIGNASFTTEWQHFEKEGVISGDYQSIAFNLSTDKANDVEFFFDNVTFELVEAPKAPEAERAYATFEAPSNTSATWNAETNSFVWEQTSWNQIRNIGLPTGDITKYDKLVIDCELVKGENFRILFYKDSSNKTLYVSKSGVTEFNLLEEAKAWGDDGMDYLKNCTEICLSGSNTSAPGEVKVNSMYLEVTPPPTSVWVSAIANGDFEGTEAVSFVAKENGGANAGAFVNPALTDGIGKDGSRGIKITSVKGATQEWDAQFWIVASNLLSTGTKFKVSFDYRASSNVQIATQAHGEPGSYQHYDAIGALSFTTEWQHYEKSGTISSQMAGANGFKSIAFNLSKDQANDVEFFFDNIVFEIELSLVSYNEAVAKANALKAKLDPSDWMQEELIVALDEAIAFAKEGIDAATSQAEVDEAVLMLEETVSMYEANLLMSQVEVTRAYGDSIVNLYPEEIRTDEAGLIVALQSLPRFARGMTAEQIQAAIDAVNAAVPAFQAENNQNLVNAAVKKADDYAATLDHSEETGTMVQMEVWNNLSYMTSAEVLAEVDATKYEVAMEYYQTIEMMLTQFQPMVEKDQAMTAATKAAAEAQTLFDSYKNPSDEAGFAAAITKVNTILSELGMWDTEYTVADLNAAVEALTTAQEAFVAENAKSDMAVVKSWDFAAMADTMSVSDMYMTYSDETVNVGGTASNLGTGVWEGLAMQGANKFFIRTKTGGLYQGNGGGRKVGILDLVPGQKVTIVTDSECFTLNSTDITEQTSVETVDGKTTYVYTMTGEGTLALTMTRYFNIFSITVEQKAAMLQTALWDFAAMADTMTVSDMYMTYSDETVKVGGTASNLGTGVWEGLAMQGANKFFIRTKTGGLYQGNGGGRKVGVLDLKKASVVTIVTDGECMSLADATVAEQTSMETVDGKTTYVYTMTEDGTLALTMTRYFSIFSIKVESLVKYVTAPNWDFAAMADTMTVSDMYMTYSDETVKVGGTASNLGTGVWEGLAMQGANKFFIRTKTGGLYQGNGGGRKVGVLNMTAGSVITIVTDGECMSLADATVAEETSKETVDGKTTYVYTMTGDGTLALTMTRYYSIFSINVLAVQADIKAPTIETVGNYYDFVTVSMACETKDASIYYSINGGEELLYEEPIVVDTVSLITAYSTNGKVVSKLVEKEVIAGAVDVPTATVTSVQGTTRVVELACALEGTRLYYTTDTTAVDYKMYIAPIYVSDTTDVWAYSVYTNPDRVKFTSVMMKEKIAAGTSVALNAPTFAKAVVDSLTQVEYTEKNLSAYMINNDQSSVLCAPTAKITYEFYPLNTETGRIAALPSLSGEYVAGDTLFALPLGKLVAKASAAGYAPAEAYIWLKAPAQLTPVWEVDFTSIATAQWLANDSADLIVDATYRDFVFNGKFRANMSADFKTASFGDSVLNNNFVLHDGQDWELRYRQGVIGLFNNQSGDRGFGFANLKKNQVVKVSYEDASQAIFMDGVIEQDLVNSNGNDICYNVTADGNATIAMNRYFYISKVGVYISSALTQIPDFAITKVDGNTHYVGMTSGTKGADIYYAIGNEEYTESQVLVNDTTGGVAPVYETKIDTIVVYGETKLYTEPVALNQTSYVRAYAMYQDVESEAREQLVEAGFTVQIAQPVIVYVGENVAGQKQFTISVDNENVISAPETPIYYTLPGGKETLYNGGTISVSDDVYGWMTAVSKLAGYEDSKVARRYIDARESYTEKYEVVDAALETVPAEAGDIEIDYSEDMNVEQLGATAFTGRVYFHRVVEANTINVSLPTVFNNNSYVTDAAGNKLERGVDYVIFEILANENPIQDVLSGNMAATAAKGYVVNFLNADLIGEEVIFVSAEKGNIAKGNFTYAQPEAGYKVVTNRTFAAATLDVPAYVLNAEGTAFDLVETGAVVAPFQSVILASADICATVSSLSALSTGIESIAADKDVKEIKYFTVGGVEVEKPAAGVYIQQMIFTDGTVKSISVAGK